MWSHGLLFYFLHGAPLSGCVWWGWQTPRAVSVCSLPPFSATPTQVSPQHGCVALRYIVLKGAMMIVKVNKNMQMFNLFVSAWVILTVYFKFTFYKLTLDIGVFAQDWHL